MKSDTINKLLDINDQFYQTFGQAFAETRRRLQPGVQRIVEQWITDGDWLDLGCGSGVLGQTLGARGLRGSYLGLDFSQPLLAEAGKGKQTLQPQTEFKLEYGQANLLNEDWIKAAAKRPYNGVLAFAALHHLPGSVNRQRIFRQISEVLKAGGLFIHSEWQFQNNPKLVARIQPWTRVGLTEADVEPGDTLLDWRHLAEGQSDEPGLRYVHLFTSDELNQLGRQAGLELMEEFSSDGKGGNLGLYQVWKKKLNRQY